MENMTSKERWLAAIALKPVDRLPFWPKLSAAYAPYQSSRFGNMLLDDIFKYIGSDRHVWLPSVVRDVYRGVSMEVKIKGDEKEIIYTTKYGSCVNRLKYDAPSASWHPTKMAVATPEEIKIMTEWYLAVDAEPDPEGLSAAKELYRKFGESAVTAEKVGESPFMYLLEYLGGIINTHFLAEDYPEEIQALLDAQDRLLVKHTAIATEQSPADILYMEENTSTTVISPTQFRNCCMPYLDKYISMMKGGGRKVFCHMCGHLKLLLPDLAKLPCDGYEAFTAPPVGVTTLADGRAACPDKCFVGGSSATHWLMSAEEIITFWDEQLAALPHHRGIVLTSAGEMPPGCAPDTIKQVCDWIKIYRCRN